MGRVVSVWFPNWATDRLRRIGSAPPADAPLVTRLHDGRRFVVGCADRAAQALGLRPGMPLAKAQAMIPGLGVAPADPAGDAAALARLAAWCLRWAPLSCADAPDGLWIDTTGCDHLHGGERAMLRDMADRLPGACCLALADTAGAAHALARHQGQAVTLCPPGRHRDAIAPLPVGALRLPAGMAARLHRLGLDTVGQIAAAPRGPLTRRFGAELLRRLDQASGQECEPIAHRIPPELVQHRLGFAEPLLTADALAHVVERLVDPVCERLRGMGHGARRLDLLFERVDGSVQPLRVGTAAPCRAPAHLARLLRERLDMVDPGCGVEAMRLVVPLSEPVTFVQGQTAPLGAGEHGATDLPALVDRLGNRFGADHVFRIASVQSDVPERSVRRMPPLAGVPDADADGAAGPPRPIRLLCRPEPVVAFSALPDQPPAAFTWRRVRHRIRHADGPERIHGEWWRRDAEQVSVRDYWRVEDEGGQRFWLFRHGDGADLRTGDLRWFLHGFF